jgi:hypothetical protein
LVSARDRWTRVEGDAVRGKALALLGSRVGHPRAAPLSSRGRHERGQPGFMTERQNAASSGNAMRLAVAGVIVASGALAMAGHAAADPAAPAPTPGAPAPAPGQPVVVPIDGPVDPPPPPPAGPPVVPEIANPQFGGGSGPIGSLRDIWHQVRDGTGGMDTSDNSFAPPPGAGPAPKLPPGFTSLTDPSSSTPALPAATGGGPPLPPGYYPLNGPPPPGYNAAPAPDPNAPPVVPPGPPSP